MPKVASALLVIVIVSTVVTRDLDMQITGPKDAGFCI